MTTSPPPLELMDVVFGAVRYQLHTQAEAARLNIDGLDEQQSNRLAVCVHEAGQHHLYTLALMVTLSPGNERLAIANTARALVADALASFIPTLTAG